MIPWRWRIYSGDRMRGEDRTSGTLFSYVDVEARIPTACSRTRPRKRFCLRCSPWQVKGLLSAEPFGRRDALEGLGVDEELSSQRRLGRAAFAGTQRRGGFPQDEALERNPRLDD
jgi:hypothetical protein